MVRNIYYCSLSSIAPSSPPPIISFNIHGENTVSKIHNIGNTQQQHMRQNIRKLVPHLFHLI